jgi:hypothetical protein
MSICTSQMSRRLKKLKRTLTFAVRKCRRPPPIDVVDLGDDWNSSESEGWELSSDSDSVYSTSDEYTSGTESDSHSTSASDVPSVSSVCSGQSRLSMSSTTSSLSSSAVPQCEKRNSRSHFFPACFAPDSPRRFFYAKHMYEGLVHRLVIRMFDMHNVHLSPWHEYPTLMDLVTTAVDEYGERVVLDLVEEHMGFDSDLLTWALTCINVTLHEARLNVPDTPDYEQDAVISATRQLLKVYALPDKRRNDQEDEADIAQTDLAAMWLLQALDCSAPVLYHGDVKV